MSLIFVDSCDHYTTDADIALKWPNANASTADYLVTTGRFNNGIKVTNLRAEFGRTFASAATYIVGFAFYFTAARATDTAIVAFNDGTTRHVDLRWDASGYLTVTRNGTVLGTSASIPAPNVWHYIEVKANIHDTTGSVTVKVDGTSEIAVSGVDTRNAGAATCNKILFCSQGGSNVAVAFTYDDIYVCDTAGSAPTNDFLGDVRIEAIYPSGNGNTSNLTGSDGNSTDNYLLVDDPATTDGDTTYVESSTAGHKDTYAMGNVTPTTGTVYGVQPVPFARKSDAGARTLASVARLSGTEVDSAASTLSTSFAFYPDIREAKPGGGVWTISDVNSAEFGVKVVS